MLTVVIRDNGEPNVVQLTFENLYSELKDIYGSELLVRDRWFDLDNVKNRYVCFVEADCLVSPGYFKAQMEGLNKKGYSRLTGVMSGATAINYWPNQIYGYQAGLVDGLLPNRKPKSSVPFTVQVAYIPGAILRMTMLKTALQDLKFDGLEEDLVYLSGELSIAFWKRGYRVYVNPKASYLTTEEYVNDIGSFGTSMNEEVLNLFLRESI